MSAEGALGWFAIGDTLPAFPVEVDDASMKVFTLIMADPNPIHFDAASVEALGLGNRLINQGTLNMAYPIDAVLAAFGPGARLRRFRCRFLGSVFSGDHVVAGGTVSGLAKGEAPEATVEVFLEVEGGRRVLEGTAIVALSGGDAALGAHS